MKKIFSQPWLFLIVLPIAGGLFYLIYDIDTLGLFLMFFVLPTGPVLLLNLIAMIVYWRKKGAAAEAAVTGFNIGLIGVYTLSIIHIILVEISNVGWGYGYIALGILAIIACAGFILSIVAWLILHNKSFKPTPKNGAV